MKQNFLGGTCCKPHKNNIAKLAFLQGTHIPWPSAPWPCRTSSNPFQSGSLFSETPHLTRNQKEDLERKAKDKQPSPPGLRTLWWDRLGVFSYTNITFNSLFQKTPILFHLAWLNPETPEPALERKFPI